MRKRTFYPSGTDMWAAQAHAKKRDAESSREEKREAERIRRISDMPSGFALWSIIFREWLIELARAAWLMMGKLSGPTLNRRPTRNGKFDHFWLEEKEKKWRSESFGEYLNNAPPGGAEFSEFAKDYFIAEMQQLRSEIVDIKNRELTSERFSVFITGAVFYAWYDGIFSHPIYLLLATLAALIGFIRFREYQRNIFELDAYLAEIERRFDEKGGWVAYFFMPRRPEHAFYSRFLTWMALLGISLGMFLFAVTNQIEPKQDELLPYTQVCAVVSTSVGPSFDCPLVGGFPVEQPARHEASESEIDLPLQVE